MQRICFGYICSYGSYTLYNNLLVFFEFRIHISSCPRLLCSFALLGLLRFLCLLLVLTQRLREEFLEFLIFELLLRLYKFGLVPYWWVRDESRACGEEGDCEVEGGDEGVLWSVADNDIVLADVKKL